MLNTIRCHFHFLYCQPIRLLDPGCWYKFTYWMTNGADPDQLASDLDLHYLKRHVISGRVQQYQGYNIWTRALLLMYKRSTTSYTFKHMHSAVEDIWHFRLSTMRSVNRLISSLFTGRIVESQGCQMSSCGQRKLRWCADWSESSSGSNRRRYSFPRCGSYIADVILLMS